MKENFPRSVDVPVPLAKSSEISNAVGEWLSNIADQRMRIPTLSAKEVQIQVAMEVEESQDLRTQTYPFPAAENIVRDAEKIINDYQDRSLNTLLRRVNVPMPNFRRLFIVKYNEVKDKDEKISSNKDVHKSTTWYGLTKNLDLARYYYSPSTNKFIITKNLSVWRIRELIAFLKLSNERVNYSYGENLIPSQIEILAKGMNITEEDALRMILNLPDKEVNEEYEIKSPEYYEQKPDKVAA